MTIRLRRYVLALAAFWTLVTGVFLWMDINGMTQEMRDMARLELFLCQDVQGHHILVLQQGQYFFLGH